MPTYVPYSDFDLRQTWVWSQKIPILQTQFLITTFFTPHLAGKVKYSQMNN